eukprot:PITA_23225
MKLGFTRSEADPNLYFKVKDDKPLILVLYVDDLFLIGVDPLIHKCKRELSSEFEMKDLGLMHYFLGLELWHKPREIFLCQRKYVVKILEKFNMVECKPVTTSMELDFKKLSGSATRPVLRNATEYQRLIGALRMQKSVALSTNEVEYISTSMTSCEAVWLQKLFSELFGFTLDTIEIQCDNQSGIRLS